MIDSHCHINDEAFINKEEEYIAEALKAGVDTFLVIGCDLKTSIKAVEIANKYDNCYAAIGIHPSDSKNALKDDLDNIEKLLTNNKVIAVGEIGLDYYWDKEENIKLNQKEYFIKQIELANKYNLPISIHCRDAYEDCPNILKAHKVDNYPGLPHVTGKELDSTDETTLKVTAQYQYTKLHRQAINIPIQLSLITESI